MVCTALKTAEVMCAMSLDLLLPVSVRGAGMWLVSTAGFTARESRVV